MIWMMIMTTKTTMRRDNVSNEANENNDVDDNNDDNEDDHKAEHIEDEDFRTMHFISSLTPEHIQYTRTCVMCHLVYLPLIISTGIIVTQFNCCFCFRSTGVLLLWLQPQCGRRQTR